MNAEITILVENTAPVPGMCGEYGFGILVKVDGKGILFDTGLNDSVVRNANFLGIKPSDIDAIVISHGHFDHTGGLINALKFLGPRDIFLHPEALKPKFAGRGPNRWAIGVPGLNEIEAIGGKWVFNTGPVTIFPGVMLSGPVPRENSIEDTGGVFTTDGTDGEIDDLLTDDQALIVDHPEGLVIVSGCAHAGMINTIEYATKITGRSKIKAWIGGTHLITATPERLEMTIDKLQSYDIDTIVVSHCTGFKAAATLYSRLGEKVIKGDGGYRFNLA
ncbi:MAG: MBL fold metallo-hydrolase [Acidobacteriota bacterium]